MEEADADVAPRTGNGNGVVVQIPSSSTTEQKSKRWFINKGEMRKTLVQERDANALKCVIDEDCDKLEENDHILKHCYKIFFGLLDPDNFNSNLNCTTTVDRKEICSKLIGGNEFSLLQIAVLLENNINLELFLKDFHDDLQIDQLSGTHSVSAMHIAAQGNYPDGIGLLLEYAANIDLPDARGLTPLHHAAIRKSTKVTLQLINKGAALNTMSDENVTTLALVLRKTPSAEKAIIERLDRSITFHSDPVEDKHYLDFDLKQWKMSTGENQKQSVHDYNLVHVFAKEEQKFKGDENSDFIKHPLVQKMLEDAWTCNVTIMYWAVFIFKFSIMAIMFGYVLNGRKPAWLCVCLLGVAFLDVLRNFIGIVSFARGPTSTKWKETLCSYYLINFQFYCYLTRLIGSFVFFFSRDELLLEMCSPMILLAGWLDFMLMFGETRALGLHMDMFYCVLMNFFKILRVFGLFLVGFAVCFWLYFHQQNSFAVVWLAFSKVIVMFIGELDYNDLIENYLNQTLELTAPNGTHFVTSPSEAPGWYLMFPLTSICLFVIAVPIVLQGLLIGIVVKDISEIKDKAVAHQLKRNANHLEYMVNSIDSIFWLLNIIKGIFCCSKEPCMLHDHILNAQVDDTVRVEYSFENSSQPQYLDMAFEIAIKNQERNQIFSFPPLLKVQHRLFNQRLCVTDYKRAYVPHTCSVPSKTSTIIKATPFSSQMECTYLRICGYDKVATKNSAVKSKNWFFDKSAIRKTLEENMETIKSDASACDNLKEDEHILKHWNELFSGLMNKNMFDSLCETIDRKKVCSKLMEVMEDNELSLLHIAVSLEHTVTLEKYLKAFHNDIDIHQLTGKQKISALHIAAQGNYSEGIDLLLQYNASIDLLDSEQLTPLAQASYRKNSQATMHLIGKGAALNTMVHPKLTTLALVLRSTPSAKKAIIERLDKSITINEDKLEDNTSIKFDFSIFKMTGIDQEETLHAFDLLYVVAKEEKKFRNERDSDLIEHPLVQKMLEVAWNSTMVRYYYAIFIFKFIYMAMIAFYVMNGRQPSWFCTCLFVATILDLLRTCIAVASFAHGPTSAKWKETLCTYYVKSFRFYCYLTRLVGSFVFFFSKNELLLEMISPLVFLAGWFDSMLMIGETKFFGLYMDMFFSVLRHFFRILAAFSIFLIGFAGCFWLYFDQQTTFSMLHLAFTKVLVMFIGEMDYNDLIENYLEQTLHLTDQTGNSFSISLSEIPHWYLIFPLTCICLFIIAVPIVLQGLLIGIVVKDIGEIKGKAAALRLKRSANHLEYVISSIDSIIWLLKNVPKFFIPLTLLCNWFKKFLDSEITDDVEVEYSFENNTVPEYLQAAHEIARKNKIEMTGQV